MSDSSGDSVSTVISVDTSCQEVQVSSPPSDTSQIGLPPIDELATTKMGNRFGGDKKKKDNKPDEKVEEQLLKKTDEKPKKKGKKGKKQSKKSVSVEQKQKTDSVPSVPQATPCRPDVLPDLGCYSPGPSVGSPTGSQGTWSYDDESDVSTLGYSTPLLSTPQVHRYIMPQAQIQTSSEHLPDLDSPTGTTINDNDVLPTAPAPVVHRRSKRSIRKKRVLGQAVIESDIFILPVQESATSLAMNDASNDQKLNIDNKICLRASRESPVSPWLRDDTFIDEEEMDEMFISCIDLSYNLTDICSEKEFTEYGSLECRKRVRPEKAIKKEMSLSPSILRRPIEIRTPPAPQRSLRTLARETPPKSDSSTSTLAEINVEDVNEASQEQDKASPDAEKSAESCIIKPNEGVGSLPDKTLADASSGRIKELSLNTVNEKPDKSRNKDKHTASKDEQALAKEKVVENKQYDLFEIEQNNLQAKVVNTQECTNENVKLTKDNFEEAAKNSSETLICTGELSEVSNSRKVNEQDDSVIGYVGQEQNNAQLSEKVESKSSCAKYVEECRGDVIVKETESPESHSPRHVPPPSPTAMDALVEIAEEEEDGEDLESMASSLSEVQLFGESVFKRLSSLVESQSQDEEDRLKDFKDADAFEDEDSHCVNAEIMDLAEECTGVPERYDKHEAESSFPATVIEDIVISKACDIVERSVMHRPIIICHGNEEDDDEGTLKRKRKRHVAREEDSHDTDHEVNIVKKPEIPDELKQVQNNLDTKSCEDLSTSVDNTMLCEDLDATTHKSTTPPKRASQQIKDVIDLYSVGNTLDDHDDRLSAQTGTRARVHQSSSDSDCDSDSTKSSGRPRLEIRHCCIPAVEETFNELLSVKHILEDLEDRTPTEDNFPSLFTSEGLRSPPDCINGRRSRMSPAVTDRTESDLDISEQRDDISTDSMYADDEDDGASEVLFSRSYSEPDGNEVVVSCTFYNTQHNATDSDDFWEDYSTADESFKQIEISADAATSTFQNARKQMQDIHQHLQDLRRQMEHLQEEVETVTLNSEYTGSSEERKFIAE